MDEALTDKVKQSVKENLKEPGLEKLTTDASLILSPLDTGYLNHVYRVRTADESKSCVVKVYLTYAKFLGPSVPLEITRCQRENEALLYFRSLVPECCPLPYFCDDANNIVCIEDCDSYDVWGDVLQSTCELHAGATLSDTLVTLHSMSHRDLLGEAEFAKLQDKFKALPQHLAFLCDSHFVKPFQASHRDNISRDDAVRSKVDEIIQDEVVTKATELAREWMAAENGSCCIHGDLHVESVLFHKSEGWLKIIDVECARIGPPAFDVALLVCNYVLLYHYHQERSHEEAGPISSCHAQIMTETLDLICITLSRYMEGMSRALQGKFDKQLIWKQILLFLGVEIIAWISGPASLNFLDRYPTAQLNCLNTALRILHKQSLSLDTKGLSRLIHNQH